MIHKENVDLEHAYSQKQCSHFPLRRISHTPLLHTPHGKKLRNVFSLQTVKLFLQLEEIIVVWNSLGFFATDVLVSWFFIWRLRYGYYVLAEKWASLNFINDNVTMVTLTFKLI